MALKMQNQIFSIEVRSQIQTGLDERLKILNIACTKTRPANPQPLCPQFPIREHLRMKVQRLAAPQADISISFCTKSPVIPNFLPIEGIRGPVSVRKMDRMRFRDVKDLHEHRPALSNTRNNAVAVPEPGTRTAQIKTGSRMVDKDMAVPSQSRMPDVLLISRSARIH